MLLVILSILLIIATFQFSNFIRKHAVKLYLVASTLSVVAFVLQDKPFTVPIVGGLAGFSFFYIVMITGALPKSTLRKKLTGVRMEFSILGFILITPHALSKTIEILQGEIEFAYFGFTAYILMIPLFITSFKKIRRTMTQKSWNNLQSIAYLIYGLLFVHLLLNATETLGLILYIIAFGIYFYLKLTYEYKKYNTKKLVKE